jgi:hypothetical protein
MTRRVLYMKANIQFGICLSKFFLREVLRTEIVEKIKTRILFTATFFFFLKIMPFMR